MGPEVHNLVKTISPPVCDALHKICLRNRINTAVTCRKETDTELENRPLSVFRDCLVNRAATISTYISGVHPFKTPPEDARNSGDKERIWCGYELYYYSL
jgi:hypothetical protein